LFAVKSIIIKQRTFIHRNTFRKKYGRQRERKSDLIETNGRRGSGRKKNRKKNSKMTHDVSFSFSLGFFFSSSGAKNTGKEK
jgi:hypothetical protein